MDFDDKNKPRQAFDLDRLTGKRSGSEHIEVMKYTAGLKAMLDMLPDDTHDIPGKVLEGYLWVIELLLRRIYDKLQEKTGEGE